MKKILISGFEPFGKDQTNPSWEVAKRIDDSIDGAIIVKVKLPVVFNKASDCLQRIIEQEKPDYILCLGQAGGREKITIEKVAINYANANIPDNEGNSPKEQPIIQEAPVAYFSSLPVEKIVTYFKEKGYPINISFSAGTYVCNDLLYLTLHRNPTIPSCFIHLPYETSQVDSTKPSMPLDSMVECITEIIRYLLGDKT